MIRNGKVLHCRDLPYCHALSRGSKRYCTLFHQSLDGLKPVHCPVTTPCAGGNLSEGVLWIKACSLSRDNTVHRRESVCGCVKACALSRDNTVYRRESVCGCVKACSLSRDNTLYRRESVCGCVKACSLYRDNTVNRRESVCGSLSRDNTVYRRESVWGCVKAWSRVMPTSWPGPETPHWHKMEGFR